MAPYKAKLFFASAGSEPTFKISWKRIEAAYEHSLPPKLRRKVRDATREYLYWSGFEAPDASEAIARINAINAAGSRLRNEILSCLPLSVTQGAKSRIISKEADFVARHLISKHLSLPFHQGHDGLQNLALKIERDLSEACSKALFDLEKRDGFRDGEVWGIWIRKLTVTLKALQLPTGVRKDVDKNNTGKPSPFVTFVRELQTCIPAKYRRSQPSSAEAENNIALSEAISRARRVTSAAR